VGQAIDDDDFSEKIQDTGSIRFDTHGAKDEVLSVQTSKGLEWLNFRRQGKMLLQHHECSFGINHWCYSRSHQLYMLDVILEDDQHKELAPHVEENEAANTKGGEILKDNDVR
jgi:hypothetical protein